MNKVNEMHRAAAEAWAESRGLNVFRDEDGYYYADADLAVGAYLAGLGSGQAVGLTEAAKGACGMGSVDVLKALDDARRDLQVAAEYKGMSIANESADALIRARAAVAELIEAASSGQYVTTSDGASYLRFDREKTKRLRAALARVQGGAA